MSAKLYLKAIELNSPTLTKALYADALMFAGEFEKCKEVLNDYLLDVESPSDEVVLKLTCITLIVDGMGIKKQIRSPHKAQYIVDLYYSMESNSEQETQLERALDEDLLFGIAWYELGRLYNQSKDYPNAVFCFVMSALVESNNINSWVYATLILLHSEINYELLPLVVRSAYDYNQDDFLEGLYLALDDFFEADQVESISGVIEKMLPKAENAPVLPVIRLLNEDGTFEELFKQFKK